MRIINLSYVSIKEYEEPESWLKRINYFTGILERMAQDATIINFHSIQFKGIVTRNGVEYHFQPLSLFQRWLPFSFHSYIIGLKPDVIIVHGLIFPWQVLLLQLRLDRHVRLFIQHHAERPLSGFRKYLQRKVDLHVLGYFFSSRELGLEWVRKRLIADASKLHEVMEVSSAFLPVNRDQAREQTKVSGSIIYLWVGELTRNKDPLTALLAFQQFLNKQPLAQLYLIFQSAELLDQCIALLSSFPGLGKSIHLVGKIPHDQMVFWFSSAEFIISTSYYEGSGTAVCEAMSCGCIPILSDIPSFRMMTRNGACGFLFAPGDPGALIESLEKSQHIDHKTVSARVIEHFRSTLSFEAIAHQMMRIITQSGRS